MARFPGLARLWSGCADAEGVTSVDYAIAPMTDPVTTILNEMISRRPPKPTMRTETTLREFIKNLNDDLAIHPVGDLLMGAHAEQRGPAGTSSCFPASSTPPKGDHSRTEFEHLEQTMGARRSHQRIRIDDTYRLDEPSADPLPAPHGLQPGQGRPVPDQAQGGPRGPRHRHRPQALPGGGQGDVERERRLVRVHVLRVQVQVPATLTPKGAFQGFATRVALLDRPRRRRATSTCRRRPDSVPKDDWDKKWVPTKDITKTRASSWRCRWVRPWRSSRRSRSSR